MNKQIEIPTPEEQEDHQSADLTKNTETAKNNNSRRADDNRNNGLVDYNWDETKDDFYLWHNILIWCYIETTK